VNNATRMVLGSTAMTVYRWRSGSSTGSLETFVTLRSSDFRDQVASGFRTMPPKPKASSTMPRAIFRCSRAMAKVSTITIHFTPTR